MTITRLESDAGWKEDQHVQEIQTLQNRLQAAEARNDDLSASIQESNRPLLRQIEALQSQHSASQRTWETVERQWTDRLRHIEVERESAVDQLKIIRASMATTEQRFALCERQLAEESKEKSRWMVQFESEKARAETTTRNVNELEARLQAAKDAHARALTDLQIQSDVRILAVIKSREKS
jgi:chromosome segregation ATPase